MGGGAEAGIFDGLSGEAAGAAGAGADPNLDGAGIGGDAGGGDGAGDAAGDAGASAAGAAGGGEGAGAEGAAAAGGGEGKEGAGAEQDADLGMGEEELSFEAEVHGGDTKKLAETVESTLGDLYGQYPALKDFLNSPESKASGLRNFFFRAKVLNDEFPTVYHAREAKQKATDLDNFDGLFYSDDPKDAVALVQELVEASKQNGQDTGAFERLRKAVVADWLAEALEVAEKNPAQLQKMGIDPKQFRIATLIAGTYGRLDGFGLPKGALLAPVAGKEETPEQREIRLERERIADERQQMATERQRGTAEQMRMFQQGITTNFRSWLTSQVDGLVARATGLSGDEKKGWRDMASEVIRNRVTETVFKDQELKSKIERMVKTGGRSPESAERILREIKVRARQAFNSASAAVLKSIGSGIMAAQADADKRRKEGANRREAAATGSPGKVSRTSAHPQNQGERTGGFREQALALIEEEANAE